MQVQTSSTPLSPTAAVFEYNALRSSSPPVHSTSDQRNPLFGDSPFDQFLKYCYEHEILNKDFTLVNAQSIAPPPLLDKDMENLSTVLFEPRRFTVTLDANKKNKLRGLLSFWHDEKTINTFQFLNNKNTEVLQCTFLLIDLFREIFNLSYSQNQYFSPPDTISLIGGFVKVFLKDWLKLSVTKLGIPEEHIPENPNLQKSPPDIDFRYLSSTDLELLNTMTQDFLTSSIISYMFPQKKDSPEYFDYLRFIITHAGCRVSRWDASMVSSKMKPINEFSNISFGDSKIDFSYIKRKPIRRHLFSQDALHLTIEKLVQAILFGSKELIYLTPFGGSDADTWQAIFHCRANLIYVPVPDEVDLKGWLRFLSAVTKQGRCPITAESSERKTSSILFANMRQESKFPIISDQIIKLLKDYHIDHHEGNHIQLIALTLNVLHDLRQRGFNQDEVSYIWKEITSLINKQAQEDYKQVGYLFLLLKSAMEIDPDSFDVLIAFLQLSTFLKANAPKNSTNKLNVYLISHEGETALQIVDGPALVLNCNLLGALDLLSNTKDNFCVAILPWLSHILCLFNSNHLQYDAPSQISRNLDHFPPNFINSLTEKTHTLLSQENHPQVVRKLCFYLLLSLHSINPSDQLTFPILEYFPEMLGGEKNQLLQKQLIDQIETVLQKSSFASIDHPKLFDMVIFTARIENTFQELISAEWAKTLAATLDPTLSRLALTIWKEIPFGSLIRLKNDSGLAIFQSLLKTSLQEAFLFFNYMQECIAFTKEEQIQLFTKELNLKHISQDTNKHVIYISLENIISSILNQFEEQKNCPINENFNVDKIAELLLVLIESNPSEVIYKCLEQATRFKIILADSNDAISAWLLSCSNSLDQNKVLEASNKWQLGIKLGVPLGQVNSFKAYLLLCNLYDKLCNSSEPALLLLAEEYLKIILEQHQFLVESLRKEEVLSTVIHIFSKHPLQASLLFFHFLSGGGLKKDEAAEFFQKLLKAEPKQFSLRTLLAIKDIFIFLTPQKENYPKKTQKKSQSQLHLEIIWCIRALIEQSAIVAAKDLLALNLPHTDALRQVTNQYLSIELSTSHELHFYDHLEKSLILDKQQQHLLDLEKLKIHVSNEKWEAAFLLLSPLLKTCVEISHKQLLISLLKQIFQKISSNEARFTPTIKSLLNNSSINALFEDLEQAINFLLDYEEIFRHCHYFLTIAFIQSVLSNLSNLKMHTLSQETSLRLSLFFITTLDNPGPSQNVLHSVEKNLKHSLINLMTSFNPEIGPHLFNLCIVVKQFSLHKIEIQSSLKTTKSILSIFSNVLEHFSGDLKQLELIHDLFDSLKLYRHKVPLLPDVQIQTYTLLIKQLIEHSSPYADDWIVRVLVNLKAVEINLINTTTLIKWCEKLSKEKKLSSVEFLLKLTNIHDIDERSSADFFIQFVKHFSEKDPKKAKDLLLTHSSILKKHAFDSSKAASTNLAELFLKEASSESITAAWLLINEYSLYNQFPLSRLIRDFSTSSSLELIETGFNLLKSITSQYLLDKTSFSEAEIAKFIITLFEKANQFPFPIPIVNEFLELPLLKDFLPPNGLIQIKRASFAKQLQFQLDSKDIKDKLLAIQDFDKNSIALFPFEIRDHAKRIYANIYSQFLENRNWFIDHAADVLDAIMHSERIRQHFYINNFVFVQKLLKQNPIDQESTIYLLQLTAYTLQNLRLCVIGEGNQNPKLIEQFIFIPYVYHKDTSMLTFNVHLNCVKLVLESLQALSIESQLIYQDAILLCKAYIGDPTFREDLKEIPGKEEIIQQMIKKLLNPSLPHHLIHFIFNISIFKMSSEDPFNFSDFYIPLFMGNHPDSGFLPIFQQTPEIILKLPNPTELRLCAYEFLKVLSEIYMELNEEKTSFYKVLSVARDFLLHLFLSGHIKDHQEAFYLILESLMPYYLKALIDENCNFEKQETQFNLNTFFTCYGSPTEAEKKRKGESFFIWLKIHLMKSRHSKAMVSAQQVLKQCKPEDPLFLALPPSLQEAVIKRTRKLKTQ